VTAAAIPAGKIIRAALPAGSATGVRPEADLVAQDACFGVVAIARAHRCPIEDVLLAMLALVQALADEEMPLAVDACQWMILAVRAIGDLGSIVRALVGDVRGVESRLCLGGVAAGVESFPVRAARFLGRRVSVRAVAGAAAGVGIRSFSRDRHIGLHRRIVSAVDARVLVDPLRVEGASAQDEGSQGGRPENSETTVHKTNLVQLAISSFRVPIWAGGTSARGASPRSHNGRSDVLGDHWRGHPRPRDEAKERPEAERRRCPDEVEAWHARLEVTRKTRRSLDAAHSRPERRVDERDAVDIHLEARASEDVVDPLHAFEPVHPKSEPDLLSFHPGGLDLGSNQDRHVAREAVFDPPRASRPQIAPGKANPPRLGHEVNDPREVLQDPRFSTGTQHRVGTSNALAERPLRVEAVMKLDLVPADQKQSLGPRFMEQRGRLDRRRSGPDDRDPLTSKEREIAMNRGVTDAFGGQPAEDAGNVGKAGETDGDHDLLGL
jgi:hypothetical protein